MKRFPEKRGGLAWIEDFWRDLQLAARALLRSPGFALTAIATLTLGLALVASTVAVVNAYLIRSMPYPAADRLHHVIYAPVGQPEPRGITALDWSTLNDVIDVADSSIPARFFLREGAEMQTLGGMRVSRGSLEALGVRLESVQARYVAELRPVLVAASVAAALVLLIVGANVAILTLLRALRRQKELAVRVALGAGRRHIARMLLAEACLVCGIAFAGAVALTTAMLRAAAPIIEERLGRPALLGVYGVTAYSVQQREREIAIRMALGATGTAVVRTIVSGGAAVLTVGLAFGFFAAIGSARLFASHIHGLPVRDIPTLLLAAAMVALAGLLATWWPARRAARIDPMAILKSE